MPSKATSWFYTEQARTRTSLEGEHHDFLYPALAHFLAPIISPRFFLWLPSLLTGTCFYLAWKLVRDMPASRGYREIRDADGAPTERNADET